MARNPVKVVKNNNYLSYNFLDSSHTAQRASRKSRYNRPKKHTFNVVMESTESADCEVDFDQLKYYYKTGANYIMQNS